MAESYMPSEKLRTVLRGFPEPAVAACAEYEATRNLAAFDRAVFALVEHHLNSPPPQSLASLPGSTKLVADLGLDSITIVELVFLFEDLFGVKLAQEQVSQVVTLDDLLALLHRHLSSAPPV